MFVWRRWYWTWSHSPCPGCCSGRPSPNPRTEPQPTAASCDEKSVKRSHHDLSNYEIIPCLKVPFFLKTDMIYIMSFMWLLIWTFSQIIISNAICNPEYLHWSSFFLHLWTYHMWSSSSTDNLYTIKLQEPVSLAFSCFSFVVFGGLLLATTIT